jgi:glycosyltransferase involved in cell wall biosynthesis
MNIVYLAPFAFSPKATVSARMLPMAVALIRRGHRVTILIPPYDSPADSGRTWEHEGVRLENLRIGSRQQGIAQYLSLARRMAGRTRELAPDVAHTFKPIGVAASALFLRPRSQNPGLRILDTDDWEGPGGWLDVNPYSPAQKALVRWQEGWALRAASAVTCASDVLAERTRGLRHSQGDGTDAVHVFPNGPDPAMRAQVSKAESRRSELRQQFGWCNKRVVVYAGTIPLNHDLDIAVKAIRGLAETHLGASLRWAIIATGAGIRALRSAIAQAGIEDRVEWHGFMPHSALVQRLVAADFAIYPYRDTTINRAKCSGKVMDYMACGLPIVVSDVGMNRVYLEHERSGLLAPPGDADAFGASLGRLVEEPTFASSLGRAARQRIWEKFGWDGRVERLERLYERLGKSGGDRA